MNLIDPTVEFLDGDSPERKLIIKHSQEIPQDFLDKLADSRLESSSRRMGDWHRFASIPTAVVEKWQREGFDVFKETPKAVIRKLQSEDLGAFITTTKVI